VTLNFAEMSVVKSQPSVPHVATLFSTELRDSLERTSPKWPILCWVGRKTLT